MTKHHQSIKLLCIPGVCRKTAFCDLHYRGNGRSFKVPFLIFEFEFLNNFTNLVVHFDITPINTNKAHT